MNPEFTRYQELPSLDALLVATDLAGRDIALRCPRPRNSGRDLCVAERDADGAARRPYQGTAVQGNEPNLSAHEP